MKTFHVTVAKIGENLFDGEALSITVPGTEGTFQVLANHEAYISELKEGEVRVVGADQEAYVFPLPEGGIAEVSHNQATILL